MLDISPYRNPDLGCGEMVFATFLQWKKIRYELMFERSWGKEFLQRNNHVTEEALKKYYNMDVNWKPVQGNDIVLKHTLLNKKNPVALAIDLKEAYWLNSSYTTTMPLHCIMAVGIKDIQCYQCLDPTFLDDCIDFKYSEGSNTEFSELEILDYTLDTNVIFSEIIYYVNQLHHSKLGEDIYSYANYLVEALENEKYGEINLDLRSNFHLYTLNRISKDIINYCSLLKYMQEITKVRFDLYISKLLDIAKRWETIRFMVTKYYYTLSSRLAVEIKNQICILAELEMKTCAELCNYTNYF